MTLYDYYFGIIAGMLLHPGHKLNPEDALIEAAHLAFRAVQLSEEIQCPQQPEQSRQPTAPQSSGA